MTPVSVVKNGITSNVGEVELEAQPSEKKTQDATETAIRLQEPPMLVTADQVRANAARSA